MDLFVLNNHENVMLNNMAHSMRKNQKEVSFLQLPVAVVSF